MTRLLAISIAVFAFAFSACEKHPLPGEDLVTRTYGSDGPEAGEGHEKKSEATVEKSAEHKEEKGGAEKKS